MSLLTIIKLCVFYNSEVSKTKVFGLRYKVLVIPEKYSIVGIRLKSKNRQVPIGK